MFKLILLSVVVISSLSLSTNVMAFHGRGCHAFSKLTGCAGALRARRAERRENYSYRGTYIRTGRSGCAGGSCSNSVQVGK